MIYNSHYWISAIALEPINNHEIVILESDPNNGWTIRHAKDENDWLYKQAAYVNEAVKVDIYGNPIPINIRPGNICRCLMVDVTMK